MSIKLLCFTEPMKRTLVVFLFLSVSSFPAGAQTQQAAVRDQAAVQLVNQALNAMGGVAAWSGVTDSVVTGNCTAPSAQGSASANFRWTVQGREYRYETDTDNAGPIYLSAHGRPAASGTAASLALVSEYQDRMLAYHLPALTLGHALADTSFGIRLVGQETLNGSAAIHVRIGQFVGYAKIQGSDQDWWFSPTTSLPLRVAYRLPTQTNSVYAHLTWDFSNWSQQGTLLIPLGLSQSFADQTPMQSCTVANLQVNTNPPATLFDAR